MSQCSLRRFLALSSLAVLGVFVAPVPSARAEIITGLGTVGGNPNVLVLFDSATPGTILVSVPVSGLPAAAVLQGIDYRPIDGVLLGVTTAGAFQINTFTGAATLINPIALGGTAFGVDVNPVPNALRIVGNDEQNLRITAGGTGVVNTDAAINQGGVLAADIGLAGAAYSNNVPGGVGGVTTLYVVDAQRGLLLTQGSLNGSPVSPNTGTLFSVGSLGLGTNLTNDIGFDISGVTGIGYLSVGNSFRTVNLSTGAASPPLGGASTSIVLRDVSVTPVPAPPGVVLFGLGLAGLTARGWLRRRRVAGGLVL